MRLFVALNSVESLSNEKHGIPLIRDFLRKIVEKEIVTKMYNDVQRIFMQVHILKNVIKEVITGGEFFYLLNIFQRAVGYFIYFFMCSFPVIVDFKIPYKCTKIRGLMASCVTCNLIQIIFSSTESFYSFYCPIKCYNFSNRVFTLSNHIFIFLSFSFNNFVMQRYILH